MATHGTGHFVAHKAGMAASDKDRIQRIVEEASKGSKYYENALARDAVLATRVAAIKKTVSSTPAATLSHYERTMEIFVARAESQRRLDSVHVVVDMDQFFAAVEMRENPALKNAAFAVGGMSMISTASYEARKYGVRSAMPGFIGKKLCPQLVFVGHHFDLYTAAAEEARSVFKRYDDSFTTMSLDEAYLDITRYCHTAGLLPGYAPDRLNASSSAAVLASTRDASRSFDFCRGGEQALNETEATCGARHFALPDAASAACSSALIIPISAELRGTAGLTASQLEGVSAVVHKLRQEVTAATRGLTCSAGIAPNALVAKIASNDRKPDGQALILFDRVSVLTYMAPLVVRKLPGVGKVTERILTELGLHTCADILANKGLVRAAFSERTAQWLVRSSLGIDAEDEDEDERGVGVGRKSISQERTFSDCSDNKELGERVEQLGRMVASQMADEAIVGRTVTLKMKAASFEVRQRSVTLARPTNDGDAICRAAQGLLQASLPAALRLLGVRVSGLSLARPSSDAGAGGGTMLDSWAHSGVAQRAAKSLCTDGTVDVVCILEEDEDGGGAAFEPEEDLVGGAEEEEEEEGGLARRVGAVEDGRPGAVGPLDEHSEAAAAAADDGAHIDLCASAISDGCIVVADDGACPQPAVTSARSSASVAHRGDQQQLAGLGFASSKSTTDGPSRCAGSAPQLTVSCPICSAVLPNETSRVNAHVDACLHKRAAGR